MNNIENFKKALSIAEDKHDKIEEYNFNIRVSTEELLMTLGVNKNTLKKWLESDVPYFKSAGDFCRKVRKPHKFVDIFTREECDELIIAYVALSSESNTRVKKSYKQMIYEYDYLYGYKQHPVEYLGLSPRTVNALRQNLNQYLSSKEAFLSMRENTIKYAKGIGEKSLRDILEAQRKLREHEIEWGRK